MLMTTCQMVSFRTLATRQRCLRWAAFIMRFDGGIALVFLFSGGERRQLDVTYNASFRMAMC
jgi:hypothetical protein